MRIYGNEEEWHVQRKEDDSPLTAADLAAHNVIVHGLQRIAPSIPILSEEGTVPPSGVRQTWDHAFVVDPLDGTKEFLRRNGQFTVNIALVSRGPNGKHVPVMGVVSVPAQGSTYWGSTGAGAFVKDSEVRLLQLRVLPGADVTWHHIAEHDSAGHAAYPMRG